MAITGSESLLLCTLRTGRGSAQDSSQIRAIKTGRQTGERFSIVYSSGLRDFDKALELANEELVAGNIEPFMLCEPMLDEVRKMPQFKAFLVKAGFTNAVVH